MDETTKKKLGTKPESALASLAKLPKIGSNMFGYGTDIGLGLAHNFALDIAREVLSELPRTQTEKLYNDLMLILAQWKNQHGLLYTPSNTLLAALLKGETESKKEISEVERLAQIKPLHPWQCHASATTPIALFNQLHYEDYKPLKDYVDGKNWGQYHHIQALLILLSHNSEGESQTSDCIYEATKLALWHLQHKKGLIEILMPDALAMWKGRQKSKIIRNAKKKEKDADIDARVLAAYKDFCKDGKALSAIQRHIQRETQLNQTQVSRSMARLGLSTRKKKRIAPQTAEYS